MDDFSLLSRLPVLRLLLPLVAGIILYGLCDSFLLPIAIVAVAVLMLVGMAVAGKTPATRLKMRQVRMLPLAVALLAVGWGAAYVSQPVTLDLLSLKGKVACARIETIAFREKTMSMQLQLLGCEDKVSREYTKLGRQRIAFSTRGCDYDFKAGDLVAFEIDLKPIANMGNPDEMDYARYMLNKGVRYQQHVKVESVARVGTSPTVITRAFNFNRSLQHKILNSHLAPSTQVLLIAMLLGNDDFIDRDQRDEFSLSGVAHVLALSGLHVGIITALLWFLLFPLDYVRGRRVRLLLTFVLLIAYDVMTGLSPSVIRATVMIAFVFMSMMFYRKSHPLNALAAAALVILVFSPGAVYSVGFQLSFITVLAIVVFYRLFDMKFPSNKLLNYLCTTLATSAVAMVSTVVLTAYYFNTVSPLSVVANVAILPVIPVFMMCGAVALLMLAAGIQIGALNAVLDALATVIDGAVGWFSSLPLSSSNVYVTWVTVVVYYIVIALLVLWLRRRNARWLIAACTMVAIGLAHTLIVEMRAEKEGFVIFNSYNSTPVLYFNHGNALLWMPDVDEDYDMTTFLSRHRAFLAHHNIDSVTMVDSTERRLPGGVIKPPYAHLCGTSLMAVGKGRWKHYERLDSNEVKINLLLVTKQFHSHIDIVNNLLKSDTIVLSGGIYSDDLPQLEHECSSLNHPCYSISSTGAIVKMK